MSPLPECGLYAVTDPDLTRTMGLLECVEQAIAGGAAMVQYRNKTGTCEVRLEEAKGLADLCSRHGIPLIVNDDVDLALTVAADGVHVGQDDAAVAEARHALGPDAIVGASCYHSLQRARDAQAAGASYAAFGRFFHSSTKPGAPRADLDLLRAARSELHIPLVAIGGIRADNAGPLVDAGAALLAVVHDLWARGDVRSRASILSEPFRAH